jgi:hypothetical protein
MSFVRFEISAQTKSRRSDAIAADVTVAARAGFIPEMSRDALVVPESKWNTDSLLDQIDRWPWFSQQAGQLTACV